MWGDTLRRPRLDRYRPASRAAVDGVAARPGHGKGTTWTRATGSAGDTSTVVTWLRLSAMSPGAKRQCKDLRARAQDRLPIELRQRLLDAIYTGQPFRNAVRDLGLTPNQVWGLTKTDEAWSASLDAALTATRRADLRHGTTAAYVRGCVCKECPGASAPPDGEEPLTTYICMILVVEMLLGCPYSAPR